MKLKTLAACAFALNTFLYGSYYSLAKGALGRIDPIVFTFFTMLTLIPPAVCILALSWRHLTREAVKSGFTLGSCLCLGLFTLSVALKYNSATGTAFFPSLNGLLAAIFTWLVLRQRIGKLTWLAGIISLGGAVLLMANASMGGARGALIAFIGGLFCTFYIFLADREQKDPAAYWPLCGVELLTMALWANLIALLFGNWNESQFVWSQDIWVVLYIGLGTIFVPTLITVFLQRYLSPVTVSFISILEPILGALLAYGYLHEVLPLNGYLGGALVVAGLVIHTYGTAEQPVREGQRQQLVALFIENRENLAARRTSWFQALVYPLLCCGLSVFLLYRLGGFPPMAWLQLYTLWPQLASLAQQGQGVALGMLIAQSLCWLLAWGTVILLIGVALYRVLNKLLTEPPVAVEQDMRTLRQMGYSAHEPATADAYEAWEEGWSEPALRRHRPVRLAHLDPEQEQFYEAPTHIPVPKRSSVVNVE
jgi:Permeases of the drug/metabolite transporter (DMT) superfamily